MSSDHEIPKRDRASHDEPNQSAATCHAHTNQHVNDMCFVCGTDNPSALGAQFVNHPETDEVWAHFTARPRHQSFPGRVHGGVCAAVIDEAIGRVPFMTDPDCWGVTIELSVKYRRPTPIGQPLVCKARVDRLRKRFFSGSAEIYDEEGRVCAEGTATYAIAPASEIVGPGVDMADIWFEDNRPEPGASSNN